MVYDGFSYFSARRKAEVQADGAPFKRATAGCEAINLRTFQAGKMKHPLKLESMFLLWFLLFLARSYLIK